MKKMNFGRILKIFLSAVLILGAVLAIVFRQNLADFWRAQNYSPSDEISNIISNIKPKSGAEMVFRAVSPQILGTGEFSKKCHNVLEKTTILGCYKHSSTFDDGIFLFDVENSELDGVKEVTAAHELLHAIWARMSSAERAKLSELLRKDYERVKTPQLEKTMANYAVSQPGEHENELHSILGTEFENLSPELEAHYAEIFENRAQIVAMNKKYKQKFLELEDRAEGLNSELKNLKAQIENETKTYTESAEKLNLEIEDFNSRAKNGYFLNESEFLHERASLVQKGSNLESFRNEINKKVAQYSTKSKELMEVSGQIQKLYDSIDSNPKTVEKAPSV